MIRSLRSPPVTTAFVAFCLLFLALVWGGGASRADAPGQALVRTITVLLLIAMVLIAPRRWPVVPRMPAVLLGLSVLLVLVQLIPLPPVVWQALPARALFAQAADIVGQPQPWRPWTVTPDLTINAVAALIVPLATMIFVGGMTPAERARLPGIVLAIVCVNAIAGLLQFSGASFNNPFINDTRAEIGGFLANRNHFALLLAIGCLIAPVWGFARADQRSWRIPVALGLTILFVLVVLASGSRAGLGLTGIALLGGAAMTWSRASAALRRYPRWVSVAALAMLAVLATAPIALSVIAGRASSIARLFDLDVGQDMRQRALPTVLTMVREYLPWGTGFGAFDPVFRVHEPDALLKPSYFNHAHNDFLEIALEGGIPGALLLIAAIGWWLWASLAAWRSTARGKILARLGSGALLLVLLASLFDYPARTPMIMALIVVAAFWLSDPDGRQASLPASESPL